MSKKKKNTTTVSLCLTIGIMSLFFLSMSLGSIAPAMNKMVEYYGTQGIAMTTVMYVTSLPQLISVAGSFIAGAVAGKKLSFKICGIIGILLLLFGGTAPALISDFAALLLTRMVFGAGFGFIMVLGNPLVSAFYDGNVKAKILSISSFVTFGGAVVMQTLCGVLADIGLKYAYLTHLVAVIPLVFVLLFLKEPPTKQEQSFKKQVREPIPARVIFIALIFGLTTLLVMPLYINLAVFVGKINTSASVAAGVQVLYSVGNMLGGLCFMFFYRFFKRFSMGVSCVIMGIGMVLMLTASLLPQMCIAMLIAGFGYGGLMPVSLMITGMVTKPAQTTMGTSIIFVGMNILGFLATPFANLVGNVTGDALVTPVLTGTAAVFVIGVFLCIVNPFPKLTRDINHEKTGRP